MPRKIVIVGNGSAGASVAFAARKHDRTAEITVLERFPYPTYSKCALPFVIEGTIDSFKTITVFSHEFFRSQKVNLVNGATATRVVPDEKKVIYTDAAGEHSIAYDSLALALGGWPRVPKVRGGELDGVIALRTIADGEKILAGAKPGAKAVVNGASFIGLEVAEALRMRGVDATLVVRSRMLRPMLDDDFSGMLNEHWCKHGCSVIQDKCVDAIIGEGGKVKAAVIGHQEIPCDMVLMCTGVDPVIDIAKGAGAAIGPTGGIIVDRRMQTSIPDVYTAGDCAEDRFGLLGFPFISFLGTVATRQGTVAGVNMAGGSVEAPKFYNAAITKLCGMHIGGVGLTTDVAQQHGIKPEIIKITHNTLPHYYPGGKPVTVKLLAHPDTQEVIGAQVMGEETVAETIDMLSLAIHNRMTVSDLAMADFCYAPACADIWSPVSVAAQGLERKLAAKTRKK